MSWISLRAYYVLAIIISFNVHMKETFALLALQMRTLRLSEVTSLAQIDIANKLGGGGGAGT